MWRRRANTRKNIPTAVNNLSKSQVNPSKNNKNINQNMLAIGAF